MLKSQTSRNKFLCFQFIAAALVASHAEAQTVRCEGLFESRTTDLATARLPVADQPIYRDLILSALAAFGRAAAEPAPTGAPVAKVTRMVHQIENDAAKERDRLRPRGDSHVRPKAMTRDERDFVTATGHFGFVDGARITGPRTAAQRQRDAIDAMIRQAERAYTDPVRARASDRASLLATALPKSEVDAVMQDPVDFAIVYAQLNGLTARAGENGELLSPFVPWMRPSLNPEKFKALVGLVRVAGAYAPENADLVVLETLRSAFAPHLAEF